MKFEATKKRFEKKNFFSPVFVAVFGSGIRDPRSGIREPGSGMDKNQDPGSGINIPDPPHWSDRNIEYSSVMHIRFKTNIWYHIENVKIILVPHKEY